MGHVAERPIDAFYALVADRMSAALADESTEKAEQWLVMRDQGGVECSPRDTAEAPAATEVLRSLIDAGADGAALVTHVDGPGEHLLAYVLMADPRNSDLRRAEIVRRGSTLRLGPWETCV